jgi:hypothetical protein
MFDLAGGVYRWRQLLPFPVTLTDDGDQRLNLARRLVATGGVRFLKYGETDEDAEEGGPALPPKTDEMTTRYQAVVRGGESKRERKFSVVLDLDPDGRAVFVSCNCAWHRREKLRKGPCAHILAATVLASQQMVAAGAAATTDEGGGGAKGSVLRPDRFKGTNFVFTGALTRFTREQAEALVVQGGGKAAGSVSRTTTHLVAGDKAGSKLQKARELNIPVLTEDDFAKMLEE